MLGDLLTLVIDSPTPVEELPHLDPRLGIGSPPGARWDIDRNAPKPDGVIVSNSGLIAKRAYPVDIHPPRQGAPGIVRFLRGATKLPVMDFQKALQKEIGPFPIGDTCPLEFGNEPVLQSPKEPLNPPLGLRREGIEGLDTEFLQGPSHLGGILPAPKLLLKAPMRVVALQGAVPILIDAKGDPILSEDLT